MGRTRELSLAEQPFDFYLLKKSRLYRESRKKFFNQGGKYIPRMLSSARSLSSVGLIQNQIEYSPIEAELEWSSTDKIQRKDLKHFEEIRSYVTNVYHEQNHRILWRFLLDRACYCPQARQSAMSFLNQIESFVVILDMALGDELGPKEAGYFYRLGVGYNPGSVKMNPRGLGKKNYREALKVAFYATFLRLEGVHPEDLPLAVAQEFRGVEKRILKQAISRAMALDPLFVELTNPVWQQRHVRKVMKAFAPSRGKNGMNLGEWRVLVEGWLDEFGI